MQFIISCSTLFPGNFLYQSYYELFCFSDKNLVAQADISSKLMTNLEPTVTTWPSLRGDRSR